MILPRLLIPVETAAAETRVAASPETVKKFIGLGCSVAIERGAGASAGFVDSAYTEAGAELVCVKIVASYMHWRIGVNDTCCCVEVIVAACWNLQQIAICNGASGKGAHGVLALWRGVKCDP